MWIKLQGIERARARVSRAHLRGFGSAFMVAALLCAPCAVVRAQTPPPTTQTPPTTTQPPQTPPTAQTPPRPVVPAAPQLPAQPNTTTTGPPGTEPQTGPPPGPQPQPGTPPGPVVNPQGAQPSPAQPGAPANGVPPAPGQNVGVSAGIAPAELPSEPPPVAPNFEAPVRPLPPAERVGVDSTQQMPLTLNDAIALALQNNNDIDASRINVEIAELNLTAARGVYDPVLASESFYESRTTPTSSSLSGGANGSVTQKDFTGNLRAGGFAPFFGGAYQLDFSATRLNTSNQFVTLNPQYPAALTFSYTQPLLRGLRFDNNRRQIEIAKKNLSLTDAQFRQRAIDTIAQVQRAYWDLVFALRNLQVQIDAVKQARLQVESNQRLVARGVLAPIDIVAATTQVTTFEQNVYTAQESVTIAENTLKTLILPDRTAPLWAQSLTPVTPVALVPPRVPLEQAVNAALRNRPEIQQLQTSAEINQLDVRYFRDQTRPQVDLVGTYTTAGLAGTAVTPAQRTGSTTELTARVNELSNIAGLPPLSTGTTSGTTTSTVPPVLVGGLPRSLTNLLRQEFPTYRVGVAVSLPLRNRTAAANFGRALAQSRQLQNQRAQTEQVIEADVRNALQALRSADARLAAAAAARASAEQQYASEQRMFRAGTTTVYLVLQRQTELLAARGRELQAQTDLNKAIATFERATGNTLEANNVAVRRDTGAPELQLRPTQGAVLTDELRPSAGASGNSSAPTAAPGATQHEQ